MGTDINQSINQQSYSTILVCILTFSMKHIAKDIVVSQVRLETMTNMAILAG